MIPLFLACALSLRPGAFKQDGTIVIKQWETMKTVMQARMPEYEFTLMLEGTKNENRNYLMTPWVWGEFRIWARKTGRSA